jgi:hypothetical protein
MLSSLWIMKYVLLIFYNQLLWSFSWGAFTIKTFAGILLVTWIVSIIVTFTECHPFSNYWTVIPDPGM